MCYTSKKDQPNKITPQIFKYQFRVEVIEDLLYFLAELDPDTFVDIEYDPHSVILEVYELTLDEIRDIMRDVEDSHVMVQTVQLKENYTGERDYDIMI